MGFDEPSGRDRQEQLEETAVYGERTVNHGRLYPNLDTLVGVG